jgi:GT2 family glycosyltransferase
VVVPTYNRLERLHRVLQSLAEQDIDEPFEVIVVSDGSTDGTDHYLQGDELPLPITTCLQENQGPAGARNTGVERASGDLVVFIDDDVVAEAGLLRCHRDAHRRLGERAVVIGPMLNPPDHAMSPWIRWEQAMLAKQYDDMLDGKYRATPRQFYTGNASVRREHLMAVGGFDTAFRRAEDIELAFRLADHGLSFHFEPEARGRHYAERSYDAWKATAYAYGRNEIVFARDLGRDWIFDFTKESFDEHHAMIRRLATRCVRSSSWRRHSVDLLERITRSHRFTRAHRYALSGVYAIEFHQGVADELGSTETFEALMAGARPNARETPAVEDAPSI